VIGFNTKSFLPSENKSSITSEKICDFVLAHGLGGFIKPVIISQLRKLNRDMPVLRNDRAYPKPIKFYSDSGWFASDFSRDCVSIDAISDLGFEIINIVKKFPFCGFIGMQSQVVFVRHYNEIFNSVVSSVAIDVMHFFIRFKVAANMFFNNEPVFKNIASLIGERMLGDANCFVSVACAPALAELPMAFTLMRDNRKTALLFHNKLLSCLNTAYSNMRNRACQYLLTGKRW